MTDSVNRPLKIFLCHTSADKPAVRKIYRYLRSKGMDPWLDSEKLLPGQMWQTEIPKALYASDAIIVFLSKNSITKEGYVQREIKFALDKALDMPEGRIFLIPARLEECEVPSSLRNYQWVDLFQKNWNKRLMASLNIRIAQLGLKPLVTSGETQLPVTNIPVKTIESHAQFVSSDTEPPFIEAKSSVEKSITDKPFQAESTSSHQEALEHLLPEESPKAVLPKKSEQGIRERNPVKSSELSSDGIHLESPIDESSHESPQTKDTKHKVNSRLIGSIAGISLLIGFLLWGGSKLLAGLPLVASEITRKPLSTETFISQPAPTNTHSPTRTVVSPSGTTIPSKSPFGIGSTMISEKDGMTLLYVPDGKFIMGGKAEAAMAECQKIRSDCKLDWFLNEAPSHTVDLNSFWIDKTEITNAMYSKCVDAGACNPPHSRSSSTRFRYYGNFEFNNYPVIYVSWNDAKAYCEWANRRLPTEAEWEKAARGENGWIYPWGNQFDSTRTNFCDKNCLQSWPDRALTDVFSDTSPVGYYQNGASLYGVLDMAGNVWEWVSSLDQPYPYSSMDGREDLSASGARVIRGGSWYNYGYVSDVRSLERASYFPSVMSLHLGFRCARSATP